MCHSASQCIAATFKLISASDHILLLVHRNAATFKLISASDHILLPQKCPERYLKQYKTYRTDKLTTQTHKLTLMKTYHLATLLHGQ